MVNKILELYSRCGKSLLDNGLNDAALPMYVTDQALELFVEAKWVVLGGDVYQYEDNKMKNLYADWYCNFIASADSCNYAKEHLSKLKGDNIYISFTIKN
ncbi:Imm40 family immunity protein (plasmid) [Morganella morganii]|uniref:Imm40 family immunity protein n=1 Tax=Morganella morganii TaxID=582 RepID=UPI00386F50F5